MKLLLKIAEFCETVAALIRIYEELRQDAQAVEMLEEIESNECIQRRVGAA